MWEWITNKKRLPYIVGGLILILFIVAIMTRFWVYSFIGIVCFGTGYYYGRKGRKDKERNHAQAAIGERKGFL